MSHAANSADVWRQVQAHLKKSYPGFMQYEEEGALTLDLDD